MFNLIDTPGPRGLQLRGQPRAGRLRRRCARRRRDAGNRGADAGERIPRRRQRPRSRARYQQDRPAERGAGTHTAQEIEDVIGIEAKNAPRISAKNGTNVEQVLAAIVDIVPPPVGDAEKPLTALVFDCIYDNYKGALSYVRVFDGTVKGGMRIRSMATGHEFDVTEVGVFAPETRAVDELTAGEVGYIAASIKSVAETKVGDTITSAENPALEAPARLQARQPHGILRHLPGGRRALRRSARRAREGSSSTTLRSATSRRRRSRSATASAAAFWVCCTWRSFRSGWNVNSTSTS